MPDGFCQQLSWLVYRICNFIKAIFGCSDWEKAEAVAAKAMADPFGTMLLNSLRAINREKDFHFYKGDALPFMKIFARELFTRIWAYQEKKLLNIEGAIDLLPFTQPMNGLNQAYKEGYNFLTHCFPNFNRNGRGMLSGEGDHSEAQEAIRDDWAPFDRIVGQPPND